LPAFPGFSGHFRAFSASKSPEMPVFRRRRPAFPGMRSGHGSAGSLIRVHKSKERLAPLIRAKFAPQEQGIFW